METLKIQIHAHIHAKLKTLAQSNDVTMKALSNALLDKMVNNHHNELKEVVQQIKQRERKWVKSLRIQ